MLYPEIDRLITSRKRFSLEADTSEGFIDTTRALQLALKEIKLWREQHCGCYETANKGYICTVHERLARE